MYPMIPLYNLLLEIYRLLPSKMPRSKQLDNIKPLTLVISELQIIVMTAEQIAPIFAIHAVQTERTATFALQTECKMI